jgi:hypothetical protein
MHLRRAAGMLALTLLVLPATVGSTAPSGLRGIVTRGPIAPVCSVEKPCDAPASVTLVFTRTGSTHRVRSATNGAYRILLQPGYYTVSTAPSGLARKPEPTHVHVRRGHVDRLDFSIDTGIR